MIFTTRKYKTIMLIFFILVVLILTFNISFSYAGWLIYHKPEFRGKVVDAETKEPIEGAAVVVVYEKYPVISGPAGGSASIMNIKETLTNKEGDFYFPSYTSMMHPLAKESQAEFIIFKPGYGSYPGLQVSPPHFVGPEKFFSQELASKGEIHRNSKIVSVTFGVVELPRLRTREERLRAIPASPGLTTSKELPLLYKAINAERKRFGLKPVGRQSK